MAGAAPLSDDEFACLMAAFEPFETAPEIAVALSGGADSLCLALFAGRWARTRGGRALGLVVDHGLRPGSADEAQTARRRAEALGLATQVLRWRGAKPRGGVQAAAREARRALLARACREAGALHLLLGHHARDRAETLIIRRAAGSGARGLAGMAAEVEHAGLRWLRPFLSVTPERLRASLRAHGVRWVEDPSNADPAYARTAARRRLEGDGAGAVEALVREARRRGRDRVALEAAAARLLRRAARLRPFGYARIARAPFASAPAEVAREALARVVVCVGGRVHAPRARRLERALATLADAAPFTLGGCRVAPCGGDALVAREAVPLPDLPLEPGGPPVRWDGRFELSASADAGRGPFFVRRLDNESWSALRRRAAPAPLPPLLRPGLPTLFDLDGPAALPHFSIGDGGSAVFAAAFRPLRPLTEAVFAPAAELC